ncbi:helix-turn-helix domain-containing protein [Paenarthrobacter ilicis]|uniref:helix-turn-helix domain-containing protein n=1 Tax=Paenarthrobacter ilicis TaxID=43665 RepID=UPI0028D492FE|nr:helix-turn-helix domain-containing protein [Paenarthrobacter ilicis]
MSLNLGTSAQQVHLGPQELSARLGIPVATVYSWRVNGKGPRAMRVGKYLRYRMADVLAWEEAQLDPASRA